LLECPGGRDLLDIRSGAVSHLPRLLANVQESHIGAHVPLTVGARYIENGEQERGPELGTQEACPLSSSERKRRLYCIELFDIATGIVTYRSIAQLPDLDRVGAPAICPGLRDRVIKQHERPYGLAYSAGVVAEPVYGGEEVIGARVVHCHGRPTLLHTGDHFPGNLDVRGGVVTWDTGEYAGGATEARHARLSSYTIPTNQRRSWPLPEYPLYSANSPPREGFFLGQGAWGYSSHTTYMVFWIAARNVSCVDGCVPGSSAIYAARF